MPNQHGEREYFMLTQGQDNEIDPTFLLFRKHTKKDKHLKVRLFPLAPGVVVIAPNMRQRKLVPVAPPRLSHPSLNAPLLHL